MSSTINNPPLEQTAQQTIRIPGKEIVPQSRPDISLGEVLRMIVRSNKDGEGQLYYKGMLIPASLPSQLEVGDKILAKVTQANSQLVLKLLSTESQLETSEKALLTSNNKSTDVLLKQIEEKLFPPILKLATPLAVPKETDLKENIPGNLQKSESEIIKQLLKVVLNTEQLSDPKITQTQLQDAANGKIPRSLRDLASELKKVSDLLLNTKMQAEPKLDVLKLLDRASQDNSLSRRDLEQLVRNLTDTLKTNKTFTAKDQKVLSTNLERIKADLSQTSTQGSQLEQVLSKIREVVVSNSPPLMRSENAIQTELTQIANRLEQLANVQDNLNQLNPVMQALGEPALLLFPFLAQGLLTHSQVSIETPLDRESKHQGRERENATEDGPDSTPYQRVQLTVPLPSLGEIHVDIAHRKEEIMIRFSIADSQATEFILEHLNELNATLNSLNFSKTDISAQAGMNNLSSDHNLLSLQGIRSFIA